MSRGEEKRKSDFIAGDLSFVPDRVEAPLSLCGVFSELCYRPCLISRSIGGFLHRQRVSAEKTDSCFHWQTA